MDARRGRHTPLWITAVIPVFVVALFPSPSPALNLNDWVNGLRVFPFLTERIEYESNVFQTPTNAKGDVIFRTIPGVLLEYGRGADSLSLGYRAEILEFLRLRQNDTLNHIFAGDGDLVFNRLRFHVHDDFIKTTEPANTELTGRVGSTRNIFTATTEYRLTERFSLGANAGWTHSDFPTVAVLTREEYTAGASVFWQVLPKADLRFDYLHGITDFKDPAFRDVNLNIVYVGVRGDLTSKLSSTFRIGFETRDSQIVGVHGYQGFVMQGTTTYRPTPRLTIALGTDRSVQESSFANEPYFISTTAAISVEQQFGPKLSANVRIGGGDNSYPGKETVGGLTKWRNDRLFAAGGAVYYEVQRWLRVGLDFSHTMRTSNFPAFSYQDDKITASVTLQF